MSLKVLRWSISKLAAGRKVFLEAAGDESSAETEA